MMPALLMSASSLPNRVTVSSSQACAEPASSASNRDTSSRSGSSSVNLARSSAGRRTPSGKVNPSVASRCAMAAPMPRGAPEIMTTRPAGLSRSDAGSPRASLMSEQPLIDAAVVHQVLAGHEAGLRAAEIGDEVATFLRVGEAAGRAVAQPVLYARLVGRIAARPVAPQGGVQRGRFDQAGAYAVDRYGVGDQLAHHRGDRARERQAGGMRMREPGLRKLDEADGDI